MKFLTYGIDADGIVVSRMNGDRDIRWDERAYPVLDYDAIGKDGDFTGPLEYNLERMSLGDMSHEWWRGVRWTKKIPVELKNRHRAFWGMKPLKVEP